MTEQQGNPRRSVALAIVLVVVAVLAFAAAFYFLDGYALVEKYLGDGAVQAADGPSADETSTPDGSVSTTSPASTGSSETLTEDFGLRLWQEQVDSQENIRKLLDGEIERFVITSSTQDGDVAILEVRAEFEDGTSAPGTIGMRRVGDTWFFSYVTGMREVSTGGSADSVSDSDGGPPSTPLPSADEVDANLVATMITEQEKSAAVTEQYAEGQVGEIVVLDTVDGPNTKTVKVRTVVDGTPTEGSIVALPGDSDGREYWFIARFTQGDSSGG